MTRLRSSIAMRSIVFGALALTLPNVAQGNIRPGIQTG
jgi:hypothetical protein